jgi:hypothetical protein
MAQQDPAFLFYSKDFYTSVATLNWEDRGKYISLLCLMHQQGRMNEETIRFLVGSVSDNLKSKFKVDKNGLWYNERLELEAEKRNAFTESRRNNGNMGGRPKKQKPSGKPKQNHKDNHKDNHMANANVNAIGNVNGVEIVTSKEQAWQELTSDPMLMEDAKVTITQNGWRSYDEDDIRGIMRTFIAKQELPTPRDELRRYWRNWLFREPKEKLMEYGRNFKNK